MIKKIIITLIIIHSNAYSNIVYDKDNILISELEINNYIKLNNNFYKEDIQYSKVFKYLIIEKKLIKKLQNTNPEYLNYIDKLIKDELKINPIGEIEKLFFRIYLIKRDFIYNYFNNYLTFEDMKVALNSFEDNKIPLSSNECMIINDVTDINDQIINLIYQYYKKKINRLSIKINNKEFTLCLDQKIISKIDKNLTNLIEQKTNKDYLKFIYENIK